MLRQLFNSALAAFVAVCSAFAQSASADSQGRPIKFDSAAVERGRSLFVPSCGFCHGTNAKGGEKGPDLLRSVLVLDDENGKTIAPVILKGRPDKGMPRFPFTPAQISDIAAFLHSSILAAADRDSYKIQNIVVGDPKAGRSYFEAHCAQCHSATGDLKGIATRIKEPVTLQGRFISPPWGPENSRQQIAVTAAVTLPSGQSYTGVVVNYDDFNVALRDADGTYHSFKRNGDIPKVELHNKLQGHIDLLPVYTDQDIHNVTAYLVTLK